MRWPPFLRRARKWKMREAVDCWYEGSNVWCYTFPDHARVRILWREIDTIKKWRRFRVPARTS